MFESILKFFKKERDKKENKTYILVREMQQKKDYI